MHKSFEEELFDKRHRLQRKIRRQHVDRKIVEKRRERIAVLDQQEHNRLMEELPQSLTRIAVEMIEKDSRSLKEFLVSRIEKMDCCLTASRQVVPLKNLCFVLTDLMVSIPAQASQVVDRTFAPLLHRAIQWLSLSNVPEEHVAALKYLTIAIDSCPLDAVKLEDYEELCRYLSRLLCQVELEVELSQQLIQLISLVLSKDCQPAGEATSFDRKYQLIDICFAKQPKALKNLFTRYFGCEKEDSEEQKLEHCFLQMFLNLTHYIAPEQECCIQNHMVYCLLKQAFTDESEVVVGLAVQILYNVLYFKNRTIVQFANDYNFVSRLLQFIKQHEGEAGFDFISDVISTLSIYVLVIDPNSQANLMGIFLAQDGLEALLWELSNRDFQQYAPDTTLYCLHAVRKLTTYILECHQPQQFWKVLLAYESYFTKISESNNSSLAEAAEEILALLAPKLDKEENRE